MKVCIIIPPAIGLFDQASNNPLGPLYVASALENGGHDVEVVSLLNRDIPTRWNRSDLYAIGFTTPQVGSVASVLHSIRAQHPGAKTLAAGPHPTFRPYHTISMGFDSVLRWEGEKRIFTILDDLPRLKEIYYGHPEDNLNRIPLPARHLLPTEHLYNRARGMFLGNYEDEPVASIIGSRGCPSMCSFCGNSPLAGCRHRSAENIVSEIKQCLGLGIKRFKFQDDSFTMFGGVVVDLGNLIDKELGPNSISIRMHTRANVFSKSMVSSLHKANVEVVGFGIESGSQDILDLSRKGITVEQAEAALRLAHGSGLKTLGFFMFGLPWESERTVTETLEFVRRNRQYIDGADLSTFVPYPGCDIAKNPEEYKMHILSHDYNEYWLTQKRTVLALPHGVSFDEMLRLQIMAYRTFAELGYEKDAWSYDM